MPSRRDAPPPTPPPIPSVVHQAEGDGCRKDQVSGQTGLLPPAWQSWVSRHLSRAHPIPALLALLWVCPAPPSPPPSPECNPPPTPCHFQFHNSSSCSSELGLPTGLVQRLLMPPPSPSFRVRCHADLTLCVFVESTPLTPAPGLCQVPSSTS